MTAKILIVEDEVAIRQMLSMALTQEGYSSLEAPNVNAAFEMLENLTPDLILLDWMMPGLSGLEFTRRLKKTPNTKSIPIILLTAKSEETDKVTALDAGADDYITKPFSTPELIARVRALLRRSDSNPGTSGTLKTAALRLEFKSRRAYCGAEQLALSPLEFKLLHFFMSHPDRVHSRNQLLDQVWGTNTFIEDRTVDVHIRRLRKILEPHKSDNLIQTVRGSGYLFSETLS
ncbi:MAG: phosphate regulon transcriptional regulator PhoB [Proteobacteria bacterium]|jgi:two-component system, OmpR family, phosphate regulon response regulator PhoB|nr:phosphate regulon transcriptional regulator PhoB [Pseudomonadota bacterium]MBT5065748.1 phosphate regulon transcriptional regulator PhoB [Pseudomonadota bacterium]MBT6192749.1 phosphate regulon transcriptional regulator PhoB [Pseudomonadota bacterium]MBT6465974.1 phosphate regulon transcriptional regulator PhoB [Pseudomonadota bacterium]MBT6674450.1 phosphate regulon transcriptional regulator PhoB [Pseudomonadota bacterium]